MDEILEAKKRTLRDYGIEPFVEMQLKYLKISLPSLLALLSLARSTMSHYEPTIDDSM
jgi:hypothetical protein